MRGVPIEERKAALAKLLRRPSDGIALNEQCIGDRNHLQARLRGPCLEAAGLALSGWPGALLDKGQESGGAGGHARGRGGVELMACTACDDTGWVCEEHAAGMPCPNCNEPTPGKRPRMPAGFVPHDDSDKGAVH
jgi:hypothetical protein